MSEKFEDSVPPQEQEAETQVDKVESQDLTLEQMARNVTSSYWLKKLKDTRSSMENPEIQVQGGDFDIARSEAYLKNIQGGKFFEDVEIFGTYDGEPTQTKESSTYDFFKGIADSTERRIKLFKNNPELVEKYKKEGEEASKIVEAIEKTKPVEVELSSEQVAQNKVISYFSDRLLKNQEAMSNPDITVKGGDFDIARCQAFVKQAKEGIFFKTFNISGTYDGEPTEIKSSSIFNFFKEIVNSTDKYIEAFKNNPELVVKRKKQGEKAQKIIEAILKIIKK